MTRKLVSRLCSTLNTIHDVRPLSCEAIIPITMLLPNPTTTRTSSTPTTAALAQPRSATGRAINQTPASMSTALIRCTSMRSPELMNPICVTVASMAP